MTDTSTNPRLFSRDPAERRAFLSEVGEGIAYFIPPELRSRLQFLAEMTPSAAVERGAEASMRAVRPGRTAGERIGDVGAMLSETAGVVAPAVVAGRAAMPAAEAVQEAFLGASVPARAAAETVFERLNQPGPMPETLYSNPPFDPAAFIRQHFGPERKAAADAQRLRENLDANDAIRADIGLPPLNPPPRTAVPDEILAESELAPLATTRNQLSSSLRLYHGTDAPEFEEFDPSMSRTARHIYTSPIRDDAAAYGRNVLEFETDADILDFRPDSRTPATVRIMRAAYRDGGLDEYFDDFEDFVEAFDSGDMYQRFASQRVQNAVIDELFAASEADALRIPDAGFEGRMSESVVFQDPQTLRRSTAARGSEPENFAQGGAVMMRSDMPEQIHQGVGSLSEVARGMFGGGPVQYMQAGGPAVSYEPQRGGDFDTFATGSDLAIQMMREARDPNFYDGELADRFLQAVPFGDAYYGEYTLEGAREDIGAPRRTEPGLEEFGSERRFSPEFDAANIRDMVQLLQYLESVPEDQLSARDRALRDEIPTYLASRTGM